MFRLESYITPLVMNYIDRYVKLKPEDFQMSLWGGAAVLNQLDLRLDAIETALNLPIKLSNGHISELKIQVPWTKLGFEPVVVTINTMECVLSLRNADSSSEAGSVDSSVNTKTRKSKKVQKLDPGVPPGYIQSLLNRIVNNVNIVVENLILKFVEEDIVFSMNIKTVEIFSVNAEWKRAFADLSAPDFVLRRLIEFTDLTVCLDKVNLADGKIEVYQDPLIYRCSLTTRIHTKYHNLHSSMPSTTKIHTMCDELNLSLTDTQLPMFVRLLELMLAIYYGDIELSKSPTTDSAEPDTSAVEEKAGGPEAVENPEAVGWASWAWSMVPQVLPEDDAESTGSSSEESDTHSKPSPPVFDISFYNRKATLVIKLSKYMHSKSVKASSAKVLFEPLGELKTEGMALEILVKGLIFLDVQFGMTSAVMNGIGECICGAPGQRSTQNAPLLDGGDKESKQGLHYLTGCLFDTSNYHSAISAHVFEYEKHCEKYKESWAVERFGVLWVNYLWIEEPPPSPEADNGDKFTPDFIDESTHIKLWFHQVTLNYNSDMKHRLDKLLYCISDHNYEPYAKHKPEVVDPSRPTLSTQQVKALERFIPVKDIHLAFLRSHINVYPANHVDVDVALSRSAKGRKAKPLQPPCWIKLLAERIDMQTTSPMYPRRLVKLISTLPAPSGNLIYHCHYHRNIKLMGLLVELHRQEDRLDCVSVLRPMSAAYYNSYLALPIYWTSHHIEKSSALYEIPEVTLTFSYPQLKTIFSVYMSWTDAEYRNTLHGTSLIGDAFSVSGAFPVVEVSFNRFEMKRSSSSRYQAAFGTLGLVSVSIITKDGEAQAISTVLQAPADTSLLSQAQIFKTAKPIKDCGDDFLCFTYQLPSTDDTSGAENSVILCTMQGWTATADPIFVEWLLYKEKTTVPSDSPHKLLAQPQLSAPGSPTLPRHLAPGSPTLPRHLSEVTLRSETTTASATLSERKAPEHSIHTNNETTSKHDMKSHGMWLDYLPTLHSLSHNISVNVKVRSGCILIPTETLTSLLDSNEHNMAKQWRELGYSGSLPGTLIICLPSVSATSQNVTLCAPVEDIPIRSDGSGVVTLPIAVSIDSFSIYTNIGRVCSNLLEPVSCTSTITITPQYRSHQQDSQQLSSLSLNAHHSVSHVTVNISNKQIELMVELISVWLKLLPIVVRLTGGAGSPSKSSFTAHADALSTRSCSQQSLDNASYLEPADSEISHKSTADRDAGPLTEPTLFFRTEAKLSHISVNLFFKQQGYKYEYVRSAGEEVSAYLDIYKDYIKFQSKIWSIELLHGYFDERCEEFVAGTRHGILLSSSQRFINLRTMHSVKESRSFTQLMKEQPREGILSVTYTRASHASLKKRDEYSSRMIARSSDGYITELCVDMARCDVICHIPVIANTIQMLLVDCLPSFEPLLEIFKSTKVSIDAERKGKQLPWFHSQTLPLIHLTAGETRVLFPVDEVTSGGYDVIVCSVQSVELTPQADNPLSRLILDNDLYKKNSQKMNIPGSLVEDRQLQMDILGLSLSAGTWAEMKLEDKGLCPSSYENPAFEWNKIAKATDIAEAYLYPIVSGVQMKVQLAPAIVVEQRMMCAHSVEINVRSDINISLTDVHINLLLQLTAQLRAAISNALSLVVSNEKTTRTPRKEISLAKEAKQSPIAHYVSMVYPINLLMTACDISTTLIGEGGKRAIARVVFSQPHTILCTKPKSERLEISCYDVKVSVRKTSEPADQDILLASDAVLGQPLVETAQGIPDPKTGIYPGVFTFRVTKYLDKPEINVVNGRPVHVTLPLADVHQLLSSLTDMVTADQQKQPDKQTDEEPRQSQSNANSVEPVANSYLGSTAIKGHTFLPLDTIRLIGSEFLVKIKCRDDVSVQVVLSNTYGQISFTAAPDCEQLDSSLSFSCTDAELTVSSPRLIARPFGPVSFTADLDVTLSPSHPPTSTCTVSCNVLPLQLGNESIKLVHRAAQEISKLSLSQGKGVGRARSSSSLQSSYDSPTGRIEYIDDLRMGTFKYLLDKEQSIPRANTVLFYSDRDYSTLTWSYAEPRVLTNIHINPMPFDYPTDPNATFHCLHVEIYCSLELWSTSQQQFKPYSTFSISEQFGTSVALPTLNSQQCTPARTWRIIINYYIDRRYTADYSFEHVFAMVSPAVLVAAMRVDSIYMPGLVPTLQLSLSIDQIRLDIVNQHSTSNNYGTLEKFTIFKLDERDLVDHEMFSVLVNNLSLDCSLWNLNDEKSVKGALTFDLIAKHIDYRHLVWNKFVDVSGFSLIAELSDSTSKQHALTLTTDVKNVQTIVSQSLVNSLLSVAQIWSEAEGHHPLNSLYAICNNTHCAIFIKQVKTEDDSVVRVTSGQAHSFCWSRYGDLRLQIALEELPNHWSTPVELDSSGQLVSTITGPAMAPGHSSVCLFIDIERVTSIHKLVTISGSVCVSSRLDSTQLDVRISSTSAIHRHIKVSPGHSFGSFAVSTESQVELRVRHATNDSSTYSRSVCINQDTMQSASLTTQLIKVGGEGMNEVCAFHRILSRTNEGNTQYCVEIVPMYSIRSYLPQSLMLSILPSTHTRLQGNGQTTELIAVNGTRSHQISLQISETDMNNAVILPLSTDKFDLLNDTQEYSTDLSLLDICRQSTYITSKPSSSWPSSSQSRALSGKFQPLALQRGQSVPTHSLMIHNTHTDNVGLEIEWSQRWPGAASLLMSIRPRCVFMNQSSADLTLVYNNEFCVIQSNESTFSPSGLHRSFNVGVYSGEKVFLSDLIQVSEEEVTPRSFMLPDESMLFMDSYVNANIVILNEYDSTQQLRYIVITSHTDDGVRVITLHDRFVLDNCVKESLYMSGIVAPVSSDRVAVELIQQNPRLLETEKALSIDSFRSSLSSVLTPSAAALFLSFSRSTSGPWSYPVQVPIESASRRLGVDIPSPDGSRACCLSTNIVNGVSYLTLHSTQTPRLHIHNSCPFSLVYGQTLTKDSEDVLEAMSLLACPPVVHPDQCVSYTFPTVNRQFPAHIHQKDYPKLKLAGVNGHYGVEVWSEAIDISEVSVPKLIHIPDVGEAKVSFEVCQLNTQLYIEPMDRAKVEAKEIKDKAGKVYYVASTIPRESVSQSDAYSTSTDSQELPAQFKLSLSATLLVDTISILLLDDVLANIAQSPEFLRLTMVGMGLQVSHTKSSHNQKDMKNSLNVDLNILDATLYNQHRHNIRYDFSVVAFAQDPIPLNSSMDFSMKLSVIEEVSLLSVKLTLDSYKLLSVKLASRPVSVNIEDKFLQSLLSLTDSYVTLVSILPAKNPGKSQSLVPRQVKHKIQSNEICLHELSIGKIDLLVSVHASLKVFVATDQAPITLAKFSRLHVVSTREQLITDMAFHYGTGALYSAGWVLGSLELLFNPTGIVRSFMAGFSDLVYLPYYGLQNGPGAFVTGVSQGMTSAVKNVTRGTLTSVTHFAQSVSRNMDRLSLDGAHAERQEKMRHEEPLALSQGLKQGFSGLSLSFLGAVAGLADQPLQGLWNENASVTHRATGLVAGLGKGLLGAVTKPISGTAEFISQTGQGFMNSVGLTSSSGKPLKKSYCLDNHYDYTTLKYRWRFPLLSLHHGQTLCAIQASAVSCGEEELTMLLLLPELVIVMDCRENVQQQAFALSQIDCHKYEEEGDDHVYLQLLLTGNGRSSLVTADSGLLAKHRVEDYVDSTTSGYQSAGVDIPSNCRNTATSQFYSRNDSLLLHEYCVPVNDVDHFIALFRYTKQQLNKS